MAPDNREIEMAGKLKPNFNYISITPDYDYNNIMYNDLNKTEYSCHVSQFPNHRKIESHLISLICKIHLSRKVNRIINIPFKRIWDRKLFYLPDKIRFNNPKSFCFIISARYFDYIYNRFSFIDYLRTAYKNCKIILYFEDLLKTYSFDIEKHREYFDMVLSFDKTESAKYGFLHYPMPYSHLPDHKSNLPKSDIFFVGKAKERLEDILNIFETLQRNNFICDFHITEVPSDKQIHSDKISYNNYLPYTDVLRHVISSRCVLEILQQGANSPTLRISEAICYGKKILSNCPELRENTYYNPDYISIFSNPQNIDLDFLKKDVNDIDYNYTYNLSPLRLIEYIDNLLTTTS